MIKITEDKLGTMAELAEKMLHYGGKLMSCIDEVQTSGEMGMRGGYGERRGFGMRDDMNYRYPDMEMGMRGGYGEREEYGERRGRDSMGRYTRM